MLVKCLDRKTNRAARPITADAAMLLAALRGPAPHEETSPFGADVSGGLYVFSRAYLLRMMNHCIEKVPVHLAQQVVGNTISAALDFEAHGHVSTSGIDVATMRTTVSQRTFRIAHFLVS